MKEGLLATTHECPNSSGIDARWQRQQERGGRGEEDVRRDAGRNEGALTERTRRGETKRGRRADLHGIQIAFR